MKLKLIAILAGMLIAMCSAVNAQDQPGPNDQSAQDQPAQNQEGPDAESNNNNGVARISLIHGDVSTQRGDSGEWAAAVQNQPLVAGDRVSTGDRSRAEVQLDYANLLRLDEHAQANIVGLTRSQIQIQLGQGRANYTLFKNSQAEPQIDTPNVSIHPDRADGSFRILVASDDHTEVIVRKGSAEISTPQGSTHVEKGQEIIVQGTGDQTQYKIAEAPGNDDFDRWNNDRDHMIQSAEARKHTNGYYTGVEDLDAYGHWTDVPDYGPVWEPTVGPGWAPYRAGEWVWEPGWGWTWVSYEPWGWAPYHYGRWMFVGGAWGWWPGPVYANPYYYPVWAPAYVSFFGFGGGGWGVGFGFGGGWGSIGWLPVGPCDRFYPWWGPHRTVFNVTNITNINNINRGGWQPLHMGTAYSNIGRAVNDPRFRSSISAVQSNQFGRGRVTVQPVSRQMFQNAHLVNGNLPVVPTRQSLQVSGRPAAPSTISNRMQNQHFFSNTRTPVARPTSFENERAQVENNIRQNSRFQPINGTQRSSGNARSLAQESNSRFGVPSRSGVSSTLATQAQRSTTARGANAGAANIASNPGWRRFGSPTEQSRAANNSQPRSFGNRSAAPVERSGNSTWNSAPRPGNNNVNNRVAARETNNSGGWQRFTPVAPRSSAAESTSRAPQNNSWRNAPRSPAPESRSYGNYSRAPQNNSWRNAPRSPAPESRSYGNYSRPPLNMRQPIVTPRGGGYSRPSYGAPSYSRPSYGGGSYGGNRGGYSAPSRGGYSAPSRGGGGGGSSRGSGGGGHHGH